MARISRTFRIFISSTFSDFKEERNALQRSVFPRLAELCRRHGCHFQAIDLRWGVSEEAALDQQTMNICLEELRRCQKLTPRPNFVLLLGNRYGWRPLPPRIPSEEFEQILSKVSAADRTLLLYDENHSDSGWYRRDENAVPAEYLLRPRHIDVPHDAGGKVRLEAAEKESKMWSETETRLRSILWEAIGQSGWPEDDVRRHKYEASATHQEILEGALKSENPRNHVFCYFRDIRDLPQDSSAGGYVDLDSTGAIDLDSANRLNALKTELTDHLSPDHVYSYQAKWSDMPNEQELTRMCERMEQDLGRIILEEIAALERVSSLEQEVQSHRDFAAETSRYFEGRAEPLRKIMQYIRTENRHPILVYGVEGSGKSALVAQAARIAEDFNLDPSPLVLLRFIGRTPNSSDGRSLLESLTEELGLFAGDPALSKKDYASLDREFKSRLSRISSRIPVLVFVDGLDLLPEKDPVVHLGWIPQELPPHARIILSMLSEKPPPFFLRRWAENAAIPLMPMSPNEGAVLLRRWFEGSGRRLTSVQHRYLMDRFERSGLPLYLDLCFQEAVRWKSFTPTEDTMLSDTISGALESSLRRMEYNHGKALLRQSLVLLAASRDGLAEDEWFDLVARDTDVVSEFRGRSPFSPDIGQLPTVVWVRLLGDIFFLDDRQSHEVAVKDFHHRLARITTSSRYLSSKESRRQAHLELSRLFRRNIDTQAKVQQSTDVRALSELPFHAVQAEDEEMIAEIIHTGVLLKKADLVGDGTAIADSKAMVDLLSNADNDSAWNTLLQCANTYCTLLEVLRGRPEALEILVTRGELARVVSIVESEPDPRMREWIGRAAYTLLDESGHTEMARQAREASAGSESKASHWHPEAENLQRLSDAIRDPGGVAAEHRKPEMPPAEPDGPPRRFIPFLDLLLYWIARYENTIFLGFSVAGAMLLSYQWVGRTLTRFLGPWESPPKGPHGLVIFGILAMPWLLGGLCRILLRKRVKNWNAIFKSLLTGYDKTPAGSRTKSLIRLFRFRRVRVGVESESRSETVHKVPADDMPREVIGPLGQRLSHHLQYLQDPIEIADIAEYVLDSPDRLEAILAKDLRARPARTGISVMEELSRRTERILNVEAMIRLLREVAGWQMFPKQLFELSRRLNKENESILKSIPLPYLGRAILSGLSTDREESVWLRYRGDLVRVLWPRFCTFRYPLSPIEPVLAGIVPIAILIAIPAAAAVVLPVVALYAFSMFVSQCATRVHDPDQTSPLAEKLGTENIGRIREDAWEILRRSTKHVPSDAPWIERESIAPTKENLWTTLVVQELLADEPSRISLDNQNRYGDVRRLVNRILSAKLVRRPADLVRAVMGERRLLELVSKQPMHRLQERSRQAIAFDHEAQFRRALPLTLRTSLLVQGGLSLAGCLLMSLMLARFARSQISPLSVVYWVPFAAAIILTAIQHRKTESSRLHGCMVGAFLLTIPASFFGLVALIRGFWMESHGGDGEIILKQSALQAAGFTVLLVATLIITAFLAPWFADRWRGANLLYPSRTRLWMERLASVGIFVFSLAGVIWMTAMLFRLIFAFS